MRFVSRASFLALALAAAPLLLAQNSGPSANGDFAFTAGAFAKSIAFDARKQNNGQTRGQMTFIGADDLGQQDVDGGGDANPGGSQGSLNVTAEFDCLKIAGNRAVMSGVVTDSTNGGYIGLRTVLVVEDGGEGGKAAGDKFTWGVYRTGTSSWVASDAELVFDPGVGLTWFATDAERLDDVGTPSHKSALVDCESFPPASYDLVAVQHGAGNIQVKP